MLDNLIAKYLADSITPEEYRELVSKLKESAENRKIFADHKNNWTIAGLVLEWKKLQEKKQAVESNG